MQKLKVKMFFEGLLSEVMDSDFNRVLIALFLFDFLDRLKEKRFPKNWLTLLENETNKLVECLNSIEKLFDFSIAIQKLEKQKELTQSIQIKTGKVYYNLWKYFRKEEYHYEATKLLKERFEKNQICVKNIKCALDNGCGSGRYTYALNKLGFQHIWGIDISSNSIAFAQKINSPVQNDVQFLTGSVLDLPFQDEKFDFVFSNGVLHHTVDVGKGLSEINRVLKKDGKCWLYLYGGKNSFFWETVDFCRKILGEVTQNYTQLVMNILGYPPGRIFHRSDFFYVPINNRYCEDEVVRLLVEAGFTNFRRLKRGVNNDWDEIIHNHPDIDPYIYGEGEMRFWIEK
jgi:ubiquinone/menaquinone biosynthesis C-methylase UbiE